MADNLEPLHEKATDTKSCSTALMEQVNQEQAKSPTQNSTMKCSAQHTEKVKELFGSLQIVGGDSTTLPLRNDISAKPEPSKDSPATTDSAKAASNIEDAFHWYKKDDYDKVDATLQGKTPEQIKSLDEAFKKEHHGKGIEETLNDRWKNQPEELAKVHVLLHPTDAAPAAKPARPEETAESIKAKDDKALESLKKDPEVQAKHDELAKRAHETMKEPELGKFLNNMSNFETREASVQRQYEKENEAKGMTPEEAAKQAEKNAHEQIKDSYKHIETLMESNDKAPVNQKDRILLAQQVMKHVSEPASISQGSYGTCSVATVESRTFTRDPAEATRLVSEVATTGQYTREGKPPIKLDSESLKKQGDATKESAEKSNQRDFASQLFEVTAANVALEHRNNLTNPPGQLRYEQHKPSTGNSTPPGDNGERLMDYSTHPPKIVDHGLKLGPTDIAYVSKEISPKGSEGCVNIDSTDMTKMRKKVVDAEFESYGIDGGKPIDLKDPDWPMKAHEALFQKEGLNDEAKNDINKKLVALEQQQKEDKESSTVHPQNEQELRDTLAKLKEEGKLPVIVKVDAKNEPFFSDSNGSAAGGADGGHVVTITDYDEKTGVAKMVNQWDDHADHDITAKQLFEASRIPDLELNDLKKETDAAAADGNRDYVKEYELLRLENQDKEHKLPDADYDRLVVEQTLDRVKDFKNGKIPENDPEYLKANREFLLMLDNLRLSKNPSDRERGAAIVAAVKAGMKA